MAMIWAGRPHHLHPGLWAQPSNPSRRPSSPAADWHPQRHVGNANAALVVNTLMRQCEPDCAVNSWPLRPSRHSAAATHMR